MKKKLGLIFGGMSTENEVSVISTKCIYKNLDLDKYEISLIYITKNGKWKEITDIECELEKAIDIENIEKTLKELDVVFPILHGMYGEDGTIQGLFELYKIPYVGCGVLASSVGMDKVYSKVVFDKANLKQAKYFYVKKYSNKYVLVEKDFSEKEIILSELTKEIENNFKYPVFVKPSNSGSSVGITKVKSIDELEEAIKYAAEFDSKILIEEGIHGREVECAVLGNEDIIASCVGEVKSAEEFYSYSAKYENNESRTIIPANITEDISNEIQKQAIRAFKSIDGKGLSRVDFFIEDETNELYINEINTLPGFTTVSMYPVLLENSGIKYNELLDRLIELAIEK